MPLAPLLRLLGLAVFASLLTAGPANAATPSNDEAVVFKITLR